MVFAHYSPKVYTYDIKPLTKEAYKIWDTFGVRDKIELIVVDQYVTDTPESSFAFVDGSHEAHDVRRDFETIKSCGTVLFHDYGDTRRPGVAAAVDSITDGTVLVNEPYALWVNTSNTKGPQDD